ncbi:ABC transporter ATP-binding protein [Granulosicoccus antarcticus]|uniref:sn-glycerol-3-phosphate import ATP-binding protein UgpC n=1 Tax=Granulosicoccus antarcticus IMCC3135 TaxID=1192854 RepID=A0A2Z2NRG7_9GAMM|nr:sn-glycerol-3-phosphate ABC transporter ATP-binding protein UgpC [Granulosicoccus antarcticus]ASJ74042.1 sn-glycerol-3-phosphate import ATP-binding protein UgpC [Granulosicoccus antarcticus IMCC3135]
MSQVVLEKIVKSYGDVDVVHGIDLTVASKEFVVLVGPSGCGKSTTLRMIAGLEEISGGKLYIGDKVVNDVAPKDRDVAMVFQNYALYPHLNVYENIAFGLRIRKVDKEEIKRTVAEVAEILSLTPLLERKPADLSGGQRQRVAMGRAIVRHPEVFLFDEPLSNLDAQLRTQMRAEIKRLHKRLGVTSVYVTHDQVEAMTLADRIVVMSQGRIEQVGTPMELFMNPANRFVAGFIGSPPMNQLKAVIVDSKDGPAAQLSETVQIPLPAAEGMGAAIGQSVIIGIRPEDVLLEANESLPTVPLEINLIEPLGSEALIHAVVADEPFVIKTDTHGDIDHLNHITQFYVNVDRVKVFDEKSGLALYRPDQKRG